MTPVCERLVAREVPAIVPPRPAPSPVDDVLVENAPPRRPVCIPRHGPPVTWVTPRLSLEPSRSAEQRTDRRFGADRKTFVGCRYVRSALGETLL